MEAWKVKWLEHFDGLEEAEAEAKVPYPAEAANEPMALAVPLPPGCPKCPAVEVAVWKGPKEPEVHDHADDERRAAHGK